MPTRLLFIAALAAVFVTRATLSAPPEPAADPAGLELFEKKVRPVLVDQCYKCHSADAINTKKLKANLLLDTREGVLKGGDNGPSIVPGKPDESRLIKAIRWVDEDMQMPPKQKLPAEVIADFEKWVSIGAPDPRTGPATVVKKGIDIEAGRQWWSFQPLKKVDPPAVKLEAWAKTPIDRFILAQLEKEGLAPNGPVSREKLIRRASYDLTGLPPTPAEIDAFVADKSPNAYEKLIDRMLASPRYGERWGRHWLDVARFGESDGFEHDYFRPAAYQYRDFVIRAFNSDMPFDRFVKLQLAGDEIAPMDWQAMAATGFLTAGVFPTQITEKEFESTRYNQLDDMVGTLGTSMLGLTFGCARCHDHKFDPIPTLDYYRLVAAFGGAIRSDIDLDAAGPEEQEKAKIAWEKKRDATTEKLAAFEKDRLPIAVNAIVAKAKAGDAVAGGVWSLLEPTDVKTASKTALERQPDGSFLHTGKAAAKDTYTFVATVAAGPIAVGPVATGPVAVGPVATGPVATGPVTGGTVAAVRVEVLTDKSLPHEGPGMAGNGNFVLSEIEVTAGPADGSAPAQKVKLINPRATHQQNTTNLSVAGSIDGNAGTGWAVDLGGIGKAQAAAFDFEKPVQFPSGVKLTIVLKQENGGQHLIGRVRLSVAGKTGIQDLKGPAGPDPAIAVAIKKLAAGEAVADAEQAKLRNWVGSTIPEYQSLKQTLAKLESDGPSVKPMKVQVTSEGLKPATNHATERGYPHFYKETFLLRRGDPNNKVEPVSSSFPRVLMRGGQTESHWQKSPPPGARSSYRRTAVGEWITDVNDGAGHLLARVIVNRLWQHHFGRGLVTTPNDFGVQGEKPTHPALLDWLANDLVEHGWQLKRLHKLMMLSSTYMQSADTSPERLAKDPYNHNFWRSTPRRLEAEPIRDAMLSVAGMLDESMYGPGTLDQATTRRSIYFTVKRAQLIPMMIVLDWPEPLNSIGSRPVTTVAPQALLFLNSPQARQYAEALAKRVDGDSLEDTITAAYRLALSRRPTAAEVDRAKTFIAAQAVRHLEAGLPNAAAAGLADFCQAMLSANEFVYVE